MSRCGGIDDIDGTLEILKQLLPDKAASPAVAIMGAPKARRTMTNEELQDIRTGVSEDRYPFPGGNVIRLLLAHIDAQADRIRELEAGPQQYNADYERRIYGPSTLQKRCPTCNGLGYCGTVECVCDIAKEQS
jgi:hypothetical protein